MNIKYPLLIPIIGHGATDLIDFPKETLIYNFLSALIVYNSNYFQRKTLLISSSIFHMFHSKRHSFEVLLHINATIFAR